MKTVNFAMFIHCHQPVGNFDKVFHDSCDKCYEPLLDTIADYPDIRLTMHFSGSLLEWIENNRNEIADRIAELVQRGQIELMGGGYYEPVLTMLTEQDRHGQIVSFTEHLRKRYGAAVRGAWLTERVWEQSLVSSLRDAGIEYTALDDSHFKGAGIPESTLTGSFVTEDQGRILRVFPGSEYLRYIVPFHDVEKTIEYLGSQATEEGKNCVTYADDGEKFGIWPKTYKHVFENGWLRRWLDALRNNRSWIRFVTGTEAIETLPPAGKAYLPDSSYREMMEWALPTASLIELEDMMADLKELGLAQRAQKFVRGGPWRFFRVKYPELAAMYAKMMRASRKVNGMAGRSKSLALAELYRGQCNCAWWHGVFGGLYLPHLRRGVQKHIIAAEAAADKAVLEKEVLAVETGDFDFDGHDDVSIANRDMRASFKPATGGHLLEFSVPALGFDFVDTLTRRKEAYHRTVFKAASGETRAVYGELEDTSAPQTIHEMVVMKEHGLEKLLQYDWFPRRAFVDHFLGPSVDVNAFSRSDYHEVGDFTIEPFAMSARKVEENGKPMRAEVTLRRSGGIYMGGAPTPVTFEKVASIGTGGSKLSMKYNLTFAQNVRDLRLAVQINVALVSGGEPGSYFSAGSIKHGNLLETTVLPGAQKVDLVDEGGKFAINLAAESSGGSDAMPGEIWIFPVQTVSQSESGFERVLQSVAVTFVWPVPTTRSDSPWTIGFDYSIRSL